MVRVWSLPCWDLTETSKRDDGIDLLKDNQALQRLTGTAEKAKMDLSSLTQSNISQMEHTAVLVDEMMSLGSNLMDVNVALIKEHMAGSVKWSTQAVLVDEMMSLGSNLMDVNVALIKVLATIPKKLALFVILCLFCDFRTRDQKYSQDHELETVIISCRFASEDVPPISSDDDVVVGLINGGGVSLTWEELWVIASNGKSGSAAILEGVTGYAQPAEVLAIMGPSGSGKSTLLDALAGKLQSNTTQSGNILINGRRETLAFGTSAYVTQDDYLMTTLTVKEAVHYSAQLQLPDSMSKSKKMEIAETAIREMGLQDAMDTRIGGRTSKGISGGQKRRVTICIEILTRPKLLFLDEPTSGLDSAASYHVMSRIVGLAQQDGLTVVLSIHQPCAEVFELFHNLCLLSSGRTVYFGPAHHASEFFAQNGFPCPAMRNPSDHYLRTINKDFDDNIGKGCGRKSATEEATNVLITSYKSSKIYNQVRSRIAGQGFSEAPLETKGSQASFLTQCLVLTRRSFARGYMLVYVATFMTFMAIGGFPSFVEDMKIFGRERLNGHYGVSAFIVSNTLSSIPYLILVTLVPGDIAYYPVGLQRGFEHFGYFAFLLFICMMLVESLMMLIASIVPDYLMGIIAGAGIQGVMILSGGFFRLRNEMPKPFWKYPMHYIAFHKYGYQGFLKNEFEGLQFTTDLNNNLISSSAQGVITGEEILSENWQMTPSFSKWYDLAILVGMVVFYRVMFLAVIKVVEKAKPVIRSILAITSKQRKQVMEGQGSADDIL
ncbi:hypothetical protein Syun_004830 [Stephania yunnanensis]|uniref:ABC transporter domain-containing protein n=1 Tax=Stephania yunnanensis TaxID=152371 RepID=A0AAP0Q1M7_9MAGN